MNERTKEGKRRKERWIDRAKDTNTDRNLPFFICCHFRLMHSLKCCSSSVLAHMHPPTHLHPPVLWCTRIRKNTQAFRRLVRNTHTHTRSPLVHLSTGGVLTVVSGDILAPVVLVPVRQVIHVHVWQGAALPDGVVGAAHHQTAPRVEPRARVDTTPPGRVLRRRNAVHVDVETRLVLWEGSNVIVCECLCQV